VTVADDMLFTALEGGAVVGLSRRSGQVVWEERLPGEAEGSPLIEGDTLIAVSAPAGDEPPQVVAYRLGATEEKEEQEAEETESVTEEAGGEPQSGGEEGEGEGEEGAEGQAEGAEAETGGEGGAAEAGGEALLTEGKSVFTANCATCHTLADAGASGEVGPNLDELMPEKSLVETQVANGGGGMPAFSGVLSQQQIEAVAEYVSTVAGG
jgi:mono/diheme cytochrome c family protein